jgi:hypothetical protein
MILSSSSSIPVPGEDVVYLSTVSNREWTGLTLLK